MTLNTQPSFTINHTPLIIIIIMEETKKFDWMKILQAIVQAIVAALTALGVSSCMSYL